MPFDNTDSDLLALAKEIILHNFSPQLVINSLLLLGRLHVPVRKIYSENKVLTHFAFYAKYPERPPQELLYLYPNHRNIITVYQCQLFSYTLMPNMMSEHLPASNMMEIIYEVIEAEIIEATVFNVTYKKKGRRAWPPNNLYPSDPNERMENIGRPSDDFYYRKRFFEGFDPDPLGGADKKG